MQHPHNIVMPLLILQLSQFRASTHTVAGSFICPMAYSVFNILPGLINIFVVRARNYVITSSFDWFTGWFYDTRLKLALVLGLMSFALIAWSYAATIRDSSSLLSSPRLIHAQVFSFLSLSVCLRN